MKYLQKVPIHKDDLFFIPAGTIHAIGAGALVAEIQESSNRPMHLDNSHTIEIEADGLLIRMSNEIKPLLLKMLMDTLKESLC